MAFEQSREAPPTVDHPSAEPVRQLGPAPLDEETRRQLLENLDLDHMLGEHVLRNFRQLPGE
jgi:hypothetical protein